MRKEIYTASGMTRNVDPKLAAIRELGRLIELSTSNDPMAKGLDAAALASTLRKSTAELRRAIMDAIDKALDAASLPRKAKPLHSPEEAKEIRRLIKGIDSGNRPKARPRTRPQRVKIDITCRAVNE